MKKALWIVAGIAALAATALIPINRRQVQVYDLTWRVVGDAVSYQMEISNLTDTEIVVVGPIVAERVRVDADEATRVLPVAQQEIEVRLLAKERRKISGSIDLGSTRPGAIVVSQNLAIRR